MEEKSPPLHKGKVKVIKKIILLFLLWRIILFLPILIANQFIPYREGYGYTSINYFLGKSQSFISNFLLSPWANFDGAYYLLIAEKGYTVNAGFFPLFPLSIHFLASLFGNTLPFSEIQYFTALFLASIFFLISLIVFYKLVRLDYKNNIAIWSIVFILLFPTSFFFGAVYSESLFFLFLVLSFYFARKRSWLLASIFAMLLTATRFVGIAILLALIYEFYVSEKNLIKTKVMSLLIVPLGIIGYSLYNLQKWGDAFYFIHAQGNFQNNREVENIILFPQTIFRYIKIFLTVSPIQYEWFVALLELVSFIFASLMIYIAWKKKVRLSYLIFSVIAFLIPVSTGTFSGLPRYILPIFPIFISLALVANKKFRFLYVIISTTLLALLLMLFSRGYFVA